MALLAPPRDRDAKQESDEETGKGRFARDRSDCRERPAGSPRFVDGGSEAIDRCMQAASDLADGAGYIGRRIDGALGHAGLGIGLRYFRAQARDLRTDKEMEAGTFGYPRERSF